MKGLIELAMSDTVYSPQPTVIKGYTVVKGSDIIDNGDGIKDWDTKKGKQNFSGVGILNVDERIKMIYGDNYGIDIMSVEGKGTRVRIFLPIS